MRTRVFLRGTALTLVIFVFALVLSTCGGRKASSSALLSPNTESEGPPGDSTLEGIVQPPPFSWPEFPDHVYELLKQIPSPADAHDVSAKSTSAVLPVTFDATLEYDVSIEAGWTGEQNTNLIRLGNAKINPTQQEIGYIVYRVSAITQVVGDLFIECTPNYQDVYGVAIFDFTAMGGGGAWQPVFYDIAPDAGSPIPLNSAFLSSTNGLVFTVFAEHPCNVNVHRITVTEGDGGGEWRIVTVDVDGDVGQYTSLTAVSGNPAISYWDQGNGDLNYVRSTDSVGQAWGTPVLVDNGANVGAWTSLAVINGNPAIAYQDVLNLDLKYARALDSLGNSWDVPETVESSGTAGISTSLAETPEGKASIAYGLVVDSTHSYIRFAVRNVSSWDFFTIDGSDGNAMCSLGYDDMGDACVAYGYGRYSVRDLKFARGTPPSWNIECPDANDWAAWGTSLAFDSNGRPSISYGADTSAGDGWPDQIRFAHWNGNWNVYVVDTGTNGVGNGLDWTALVYYQGIPVISYYDITTRDLKVAFANNEQGSSWQTPVVVDSEGNVGSYTCAAIVNGKIAISYHDGGNGDLKFAIYY